MPGAKERVVNITWAKEGPTQAHIHKIGGRVTQRYLSFYFISINKILCQCVLIHTESTLGVSVLVRCVDAADPGPGTRGADLLAGSRPAHQPGPATGGAQTPQEPQAAAEVDTLCAVHVMSGVLGEPRGGGGLQGGKTFLPQNESTYILIYLGSRKNKIFTVE